MVRRQAERDRRSQRRDAEDAALRAQLERSRAAGRKGVTKRRELDEQLQALSPVGRCKTFDSSGDGYGRGEGCAVMIMRPSGSGDGDALALVRSTVVNQDGRSSSLTAPNGPSQTTLVSTALQGIGEPVQDD